MAIPSLSSRHLLFAPRRRSVRARAIRSVAGIVLSAVLAAACETVVDVDLPVYRPQLVVVGSFSPQSAWDVQVSHSVALLDSVQIEPVADAVVEIWQGDRRLLTLPHRPVPIPAFGEGFAFDGFYVGDAPRPVVGTPYTLRVTAPGYEAVEATDAVPPAVPIVSHGYADSVLIETEFEGAPIGEMRIVLQDPPGEPNYYRLRVSNENRETEGFLGVAFAVNPDLHEAYGESESLGIGAVTETLPLRGALYFDDRLFEGDRYELVVRLRTTDLYGLTFSAQGGRIQANGRIRLETIGEAMYRSERSKVLQATSRDNPFAEPVPIYSNVDRGLGSFAGFHTVFDERVALRRDTRFDPAPPTAAR